MVEVENDTLRRRVIFSYEGVSVYVYESGSLYLKSKNKGEGEEDDMRYKHIFKTKESEIIKVVKEGMRGN